MGPDDYDVAVTDRAPHRIQDGDLAAGTVIAQSATNSMVVRLPEGADDLRVRAQVTGATADLELVPLLADRATESSTNVPATEALADGTESSVDVALKGERLWVFKVTNTGAGADLTLDFIDIYVA